MTIVDTNVVSALMLEEPDPVVRSWLDSRPRSMLWLTSVTFFELRAGLELLAVGKRRARLEIELIGMLAEDFQNRMLPFDRESAEFAAILSAQRRRNGLNIDIRDTQIAGIALAHRATLATRNIRHFQDAGLTLIDPWVANASG